MAMNAGTAAVAGRRRHSRRPVMSEINVTPMVDVMLVLLIIFMVSAPLMVNLIPIELAEAKSGSPAVTTERQFILTLKKATGGNCTGTSDLYLRDNADGSDVKVPVEALEEKLKELKGSNPTQLAKNIRVRAEKNTCHQDYGEVLGLVREAGFGADVEIIPPQRRP
jgi:biopolymer transport protein TolR